MATLTKRATIYLDPEVHKVLRVRSLEMDLSISEIVNDVLLRELKEDFQDLEVFAVRAKEPTISYEDLLKKLKADGKI